MPPPSAAPDASDAAPDREPDSPLKTQVDTDDIEWTHVTRKGKRQGKGQRPGRLVHVPVAEPSSLPPRSAPTLTVEQIRLEHDRIVTQWRAKPSAAALTEFINSKLDTHVSREIDRAICLGNGSFDPPEGIRTNIWRAHVQTEAFLSIVRAIENHRGSKIDCFFQEPLYTEPDITFLESMGHAVTVNPAAFDLVTPTTLVFGIHLYRPEYARLIAKGLPAMLVGNDQTYYEHLPRDPEMDGLQCLDEKLEKFAFPREAGDHCFSDTCIYWAKPPAET